MELLKSHLMQKYGEGHNAWKEPSEKLFGPTEAVAVWNNLRSDGLLPAADKDIVVVSTTANLPTHELAMFQDETQYRTGRTRFIVGDIAKLPVQALIAEKLKDTIADGDSFDYLRWDAETLPLAPDSVDILLDRKGWLWHCTGYTEDPARVLQSLESYAQVLKPGGSLVIDNLGGFYKFLATQSLEEQINILLAIKRNEPINELIPNPPGQYEDSTVDIIKQLSKVSHVDIFAHAKRYYDISTLGEGNLSVMVLTRPSSQQQV